MSPAKTNAERQADLVTRKKAAGLAPCKNIWVHPDDMDAMREHAAKLSRKRARTLKNAAL